MPRGPKGEKRLADVIGNAVLVMKIATGKPERSIRTEKPQAVTIGRLAARRAERE
jgi:hypothetical protein